LLRQLAATLLQAIMPQPSFDLLRQLKATLNRHLHEPRRRRQYQNMPKLF